MSLRAISIFEVVQSMSDPYRFRVLTPENSALYNSATGTAIEVILVLPINAVAERGGRGINEI